MLTKAQLRAQYLKTRNQLSAAYTHSANNRIVSIFSKLHQDIQPEIVAAYYPLGSEFNAVLLLRYAEQQNSQTALVKIKDEQIYFASWSPSDALQYNKKFPKIQEPTNNSAVIPDMVIVPLLCFDDFCYRIGYGRGFYDKLITHYKTHHKNSIFIGVGFACQHYTQKLPINSLDQQLNFIITDEKLYTC